MKTLTAFCIAISTCLCWPTPTLAAIAHTAKLTEVGSGSASKLTVKKEKSRRQICSISNGGKKCLFGRWAILMLMAALAAATMTLIFQLSINVAMLFWLCGAALAVVGLFKDEDIQQARLAAFLLAIPLGIVLLGLLANAIYNFD